jgi:hypothetical protein
VVLPRQPRTGAPEQDVASSHTVPGVDQPAGVAGYRRAAAPAG